MKPWLIGLLALLYFNAPALAQQKQAMFCAPVKALEIAVFNSGEVLVNTMSTLPKDGPVLHTYARADGATWTMLLIFPDGRMGCIAGVGRDYVRIPPGDPA